MEVKSEPEEEQEEVALKQRSSSRKSKKEKVGVEFRRRSYERCTSLYLKVCDNRPF